MHTHYGLIHYWIGFSAFFLVDIINNPNLITYLKIQDIGELRIICSWQQKPGDVSMPSCFPKPQQNMSAALW